MRVGSAFILTSLGCSALAAPLGALAPRADSGVPVIKPRAWFSGISHGEVLAMGVGVGAAVTALIGGIGVAIDHTEKTGRYHPEASPSASSTTTSPDATATSTHTADRKRRSLEKRMHPWTKEFIKGVSKEVGKSTVKVGLLAAGIAVGALAVDDVFGGGLFTVGNPPAPLAPTSTSTLTESATQTSTPV